MNTTMILILGGALACSATPSNLEQRQACAGGSGWTDPTCCTAGDACQITNLPRIFFYAHCCGYFSTTTKTTTTTTTLGPTGTHTQAPYPSVSASNCGSWTLVDNVCCPSYCKNDLTSENCLSCGSANCCASGNMFPEGISLTDNVGWHFSRSTHFGLYSTATDAKSQLGTMCDAFCKSYPQLCADPMNVTFRGNFASPNGDYYSQFWRSLPGDRDNYLSCGEYCFELVSTKKDGTDYQPGEPGYSPPVVLTVVDSCPCSANSKWCCGSRFTYECPLPSDSIHLDLSDIAMSRLQAGSLVDGVIPTRYRRTKCPTLGNAYLWLSQGASSYYMALSVVNTAGVGSVVNIEIQGANTSTWTALTSGAPWILDYTISQESCPFNLAIAVRVTGASGEVFTSSPGITSFTPPTGAEPDSYYIDL
ncbi:Non-catalytic module family expansin [Cladochytrium replicatum]|nr:Non-catalytic module family expansin [Cladochytrium replicatum]